MSNRKETLTQDQTVISVAKLERLMVKEANHDGYLAATLAMGVKLRKHQELLKDAVTTADGLYHLGWLDCLKQYNEIVYRMVSDQLDAHPHMDERWPRRVRKGQVCIVDEPGCSCLVAIR